MHPRMATSVLVILPIRGFYLLNSMINRSEIFRFQLLFSFVPELDEILGHVNQVAGLRVTVV